jgi:hypothetical protein
VVVHHRLYQVPHVVGVDGVLGHDGPEDGVAAAGVVAMVLGFIATIAIDVVTP